MGEKNEADLYLEFVKGFPSIPSSTFFLVTNFFFYFKLCDMKQMP